MISARVVEPGKVLHSAASELTFGAEFLARYNESSRLQRRRFLTSFGLHRRNDLPAGSGLTLRKSEEPYRR